MSGTLVRIQGPSCSREQAHVQQWLKDHATNPFPSPSKKAEMAATLGLAEFRLNHLVYNTRKRMFPGLCKKKAPREPQGYAAAHFAAAGGQPLNPDNLDYPHPRQGIAHVRQADQPFWKQVVEPRCRAVHHHSFAVAGLPRTVFLGYRSNWLDTRDARVVPSERTFDELTSAQAAELLVHLLVVRAVVIWIRLATVSGRSCRPG